MSLRIYRTPGLILVNPSLLCPMKLPPPPPLFLWFLKYGNFPGQPRTLRTGNKATWEVTIDPGPILASQMALVVRNMHANAVDTRHPGSIPGLGRSPGEGNGNPLQYSCLEKSHGQRSLVGYSQKRVRWLKRVRCNWALVSSIGLILGM